MVILELEHKLEFPVRLKMCYWRSEIFCSWNVSFSTKVTIQLQFLFFLWSIAGETSEPCSLQVVSHVSSNNTVQTCVISVILAHVSSWKKVLGELKVILPGQPFFSASSSAWVGREGVCVHVCLVEKARDVKWSIQPLSVCHCQPGPPESFALRGGMGLGGFWHKEVEVFLVSHLPQEKASCQKNCMSRETSEKTLCGSKRCIFHHTVLTVAAFSSVGRRWHCRNLCLSLPTSSRSSQRRRRTPSPCYCKWGRYNFFLYTCKST